MKTITLGFLVAIGFAAATSAVAVEATRFDAPDSWTSSRSEVQAEARRAAAADELAQGEAGLRFGDPAAPRIDPTASGTTMRAGADQGPGHRDVAGDYVVGGM